MTESELKQRLQKRVAEIIEAKYYGTFRRRLLDRDRYARLSKTHHGSADVARFAAAAHGSFSAIQARFEKELLDMVTQYASLHMNHQRKAKLAKRGKTIFTKSRLTAKSVEIKKLFRKYYEQAYCLGVSSSLNAPYSSRAHLEPEEERWLESACRHEARFFNGFLSEIRSGKSVASVRHRVGMYAKTLDSIYKAGQVSGQHPDTVIHWRVNPELENCPDCLELARNGPYTKETLPTQPRAGATCCLFNCGCQLEYQSVTSVQVAKVAKANKSKGYLIGKLLRRRRK